MHRQCINCDIKQVNKIKNILSLDITTEMKITELVTIYLKTCNMKKSNPEIMGNVWNIITKEINNDDPYKDIKNYYNSELLKMKNKIELEIDNSEDKYLTALKISILGNLIDFSANHSFDMNILMEKINNISNIKLSIDDSDILYNELCKARTVLYIGDNCGEIVLDKIFISCINKLFPSVTFYYGVRGFPIINDVTFEDANNVNMSEVATVISNGDQSLGTVLEKTSLEFQEIYNKSDVIISKGQGNYEGLMNNNKNNVFFMFMAKCDIIAKPLNISKFSIICMRKENM